MKVTCLECGVVVERKPSHKAKFCSISCRDAYAEKRFERWAANPQPIGKPVNYADFLAGKKLPCLVKGCTWAGVSLAMHMNIAHGVREREFKRLAGFNLKGGVCTPARSAQISRYSPLGRPHIQAKAHAKRKAAMKRPRTGYISDQARESWREATPDRGRRAHVCKRCGEPFDGIASATVQYCSLSCRDAMNAEREHAKRFTLVCMGCGGTFIGSRVQQRRADKGTPVACSLSCRNRRAARSRAATAAHAST